MIRRVIQFFRIRDRAKRLKEREEHELAVKHGARRCAAEGHAWDIAAMGPDGSALDCTRPECKLIYDSNEGLTWNS